MEEGKVKPLRPPGRKILHHVSLSFTVTPLWKSREGADAPGKEPGVPGRGSGEAEAPTERRSPAVVRAPQSQQQQQDEQHHAHGHHGDVPLPPEPRVAQLPPLQVSVLTPLPDEADNTAVTTHKQRSDKNASVFQTRYPAVGLCVSRPSFVEAHGRPGGSAKALCSPGRRHGLPCARSPRGDAPGFRARPPQHIDSRSVTLRLKSGGATVNTNTKQLCPKSQGGFRTNVWPDRDEISTLRKEEGRAEPFPGGPAAQ